MPTHGALSRTSTTSALIESQLLSALRGDGDVQAGFSVSQQYFHVLLHLLAIAAGNGAEPLVAGAGLQGKARDGRQQAIQRQGIVIAEYIKRFLLDLRPADRTAGSDAARSGSAPRRRRPFRRWRDPPAAVR